MDTKFPENQPAQSTDSGAKPSSVAVSPSLNASSGTVGPEGEQQSSTVIMPEPTQKLPFWFYILFAVVALTFFFMTFLLIKTLFLKQKPGKQVTKTTHVSQATITPAVIPTPVDQYLNQLNNAVASDEIASIESDLEATNLSELKVDIDKMDKEVNP